MEGLIKRVKSRSAYVLELDPVYCDVIIKRWEQFTGGKAELIKDKRKRDDDNGRKA
jgi:DNA modification methylase